VEDPETGEITVYPFKLVRTRPAIALAAETNVEKPNPISHREKVRLYNLRSIMAPSAAQLISIATNITSTKLS